MTKKKNAKQKKKGNRIVPGAAIAAPNLQQRRQKRMEQRKRKLHSVVDIQENESDSDASGDEVEVVSKPAAPARKRQRGQLPPRPPPKPSTKKATKPPPPLPRPRRKQTRNIAKDDAAPHDDNHNDDDGGNASDSSLETPYRMNLTQQNVPVKSARKTKKKKEKGSDSEDGSSSSDSNSSSNSDSSSDEDDGYGPMFESPLSQPPEYLDGGKHQQNQPPLPPLPKQNRETLRPGDVIAYQNTTVAVAGSSQGRGRAVVLATHPHKEYPLILHNGALLPSSTPIQRIAEYRDGVLYGHPGRHKPISKFRLKERQLDMPGVDKVNYATGLLQQAASLKQMKSTIESTAVVYLRGDKDKKKKRRGKENSQPDSNADSSDSEGDDDDKKQNASSKAKKGDAKDDNDDSSTSTASSASSSLTIPSLRPVSEKRSISDKVLKKPPPATTPSKSTSLTLNKYVPKSKRKSRGNGKTSKTKSEKPVEATGSEAPAKKETRSGQATGAPKKPDKAPAPERRDKASGVPQKGLSPDDFKKEAAAALLFLHGDIPETRSEAPQLQTQQDAPSENVADHDHSDGESTSEAPQLQIQQEEPLTRRRKSSAYDTDSEDNHDRHKTETNKAKRQLIEKKSLPRPAAAMQNSDLDTDEELLAIQKRKDKDKKARGNDPNRLKGASERSNGPSTEQRSTTVATSKTSGDAVAAKTKSTSDASPKRKSLGKSRQSNIDLASSDDEDDDSAGLRPRVFRKSTGGRKSDAAGSTSRRPSPNDKSKKEAKEEDALIGQSISFQPQNDDQPEISPIVPARPTKRDELLDASDSDEEFDRQIQENLENNTSALLRIKKDSVASSNKSAGSDASAEESNDEESQRMETKRRTEPKVQPRGSSSKRWFGFSQPRPIAQGSDKKQPKASQQGSPPKKKPRKSVGRKSSIRSQKPRFEPLTLVPTRRLSYGADSPINLESDGSDASEEADEESPPSLAKAYRKLEMRKQQQRQKSGGRESIETGKRDKTASKGKDRHKTNGKKGKRSTTLHASPKGSSGKRRNSRPKAPRARIHHDSDADSESEIDRNPRTRRSSRPPRYPTVSMKRTESHAVRKESSQSEAEFEWQEEASGTSHRKDERIGFGGQGSYESSDSDDESGRPQKTKAPSRSKGGSSSKRRGNESDVSSLESDDDARRRQQLQRSRELAQHGRNPKSNRRNAGTKRKKDMGSSDEASVPSVVDLTNQESANGSKGRQVSAKPPIPASVRKRRRVRGLPPTSDNYRAISKLRSPKAKHLAREHISRLEMETNVPNRFELSSSSDDDYNTHTANKRRPHHSTAGRKSTNMTKKPSAKTGGKIKASESGSIFDFDSCDENEKSLALSTRKRYVNART